MSEETINETAPETEATGFADQTTSESDAAKPEQGFADMPSEEKPAEGEQPASEEKTEEAKKEDKPDLDYVLSSPENLPLPEENLKSFTEACHKAGLTKEQADAMLNWHGQHHEAVQQFQAQAWGQTLKGWGDELASDPDFGGSKLKDTYGYAIKALKQFDDDKGSLRTMLQETKYQYNPTIIRAFARVGMALGEHGFVGQRGEGASEQTLEKRMYPDFNF